MRKSGFLSLTLLAGTLAVTFNGTPNYSITNIPLPAEMDKQVCISGLVYNNGHLYFASERCPIVIETDPAGKILNTHTMNVPQEFEMEGITTYKSKLYLISENVAALYEFDPATATFRQVGTGSPLPGKTKNGDGMEGIAANAKNGRFYLLRERNEERTASQIFTYVVKEMQGTISLELETSIQFPLENSQWRYSDICYDEINSRLILLKSYSKGKTRQQFIETLDISAEGKLQAETKKDLPVANFSSISNQYKNQDYSMNLEGITQDAQGNFFIVSDNTSGKARCDEPAQEKTILLMLRKDQAAKE
jgi:uncharacterized protein YjiK